MERLGERIRAWIQIVLPALLLVGVLFSYPYVANASDTDEFDLVTHFYGSIDAQDQTRNLMLAANPEMQIEHDIHIGEPRKVQYLRYASSGQLINSVLEEDSFEWVSPVNLEGNIVGSITIWNNNGHMEVGNFTTDVEMASFLPEDPYSTLLVDNISRAFYLMDGSFICGINAQAEQLIPEPLDLSQGELLINRNFVYHDDSGYKVEGSAGGGGVMITTVPDRSGQSNRANYILLIVVFTACVVSLSVILCMLRKRNDK